jgi:hypothetical protein
VVISGSLLADLSAGSAVVLWQELPGQTSFHQVAQTTTTAGGHYTFTLARGKVTSDRKWYVTAGGLRSATLDQHVGAVIGLAISSVATTAGVPVALRGSVTPSHAGETLLIEQLTGGRWLVVARPRLSRGSTYSISHRFAHAGTARLKAVLRGDARNETSTSRTVTVLVKP